MKARRVSFEVAIFVGWDKQTPKNLPLKVECAAFARSRSGAGDPKLKRTVAIKRLRAGIDAPLQESLRIRTEAEAVARVHHDSFVQIHDIGQHDAQPYLAMEYCAGGSLADRLRVQPMSAHDAAQLVATIRATASGNILGSPAYMAPEQAHGDSKRIGPAADVYSIGAILYECLTRCDIANRFPCGNCNRKCHATWRRLRTSV